MSEVKCKGCKKMIKRKDFFSSHFCSNNCYTQYSKNLKESPLSKLLIAELKKGGRDE